MTTRATVYFTIAGVFAVLVFLAVIVSTYLSVTLCGVTSWIVMAIPLFLVLSIPLAYVFASPWLRLGNRVLEERDELLMHIDTAINTATMAAAIQRLERGS
jgi:Na+-driven multidrug efflux pump